MPAKPLPIPTALLARFLSGELTVRALSRLLHRDPQALLAQLRGLGIDTSRSHRKALAIARGKGYQDSAAMGARAAELYAAGLSLRRVASKTGLTCEGVGQVLLRNGVNVRGRGAAVFARCPPAGRLDPDDFGRRLRSLRAGAGLSQRALACRSCLQPGTVRRLERARTRPTWATLDQLARALGCGVEALGLRQRP